MKKLLVPIDLLMYGCLYCLIGVFILILGICRIGSKKEAAYPKSRRVLQLTHYNINDIVQAGDKHIVFRSDLDGYLDRVVTVLFSSASPERFDQAYGDIHRIVHVPQKPENPLKEIGLIKTTYALSSLSLISTIVSLVRREDVGLIRAQDPLLFGFVARIVSLVSGVPYAIHVIQNYDISTRRIQRLAFPPFIFRGVERDTERAVLEGACFVTSSYANYKFYAMSHGADPERTFSLRTPVNECHFKPLAERKMIKAKLGIEGRKAVLYVGRLEKVKFVEDLIGCLEIIKRSFPDVVLLIAGRGSLKDALEKRADSMGLESNVIFLGNVAQQDLVDLYYTADTIVFTHAGITLVEAALSSKPIACYDHDWAEEFIGYNERGLLSPFRDIEALSENIIGLLKNERDAASLGNAAREFAARNFNRDAIAGREREVLGRFFDDGISKGRSS